MAGPERIMFNNVVRRVTIWNEVEPFYKDGKAGPTKSIESRSTEAVLNAVILASYDSRTLPGNRMSRNITALHWQPWRPGLLQTGMPKNPRFGPICMSCAVICAGNIALSRW